MAGRRLAIRLIRSARRLPIRGEAKKKIRGPLRLRSGQALGSADSARDDPKEKQLRLSGQSECESIFCLFSILCEVSDSEGSIQIQAIFAFLYEALGILSGPSRARSLRYMFLS